MYIMKEIKSILIGFSILFGIILIVGVVLVLAETFKMQLELSANGLSIFTENFTSLNSIFTVTIALLSTYFILVQVENLTISNRRTSEILENELKNMALNQSKFFYTELQARVRETYILIDNRSKYLLSQKWDIIEFNDESVCEQNLKWEQEYENLQQSVKDRIIEILNQFESLAAIVLYGNIDKGLAFDLFGRPFIRQIETWYPFISGYRSRKKEIKEDNYNSIIKIYNEWSKEINK